MKKTLKVFRIEVKEHLESIHQLANQCTQIIANLKSDYNWDNQKDARILFFVFMREGIQSYFLGECLSKKLINKKWYNNNGMGNSLKGDKESVEKFMRDRFFQFGVWSKSAFFISTFTEVENILRIIAKEYDNSSSYNINITKLAENLINSLVLDTNYLNLWKVFAYTRNTIHSGGFHTHSSGSQVINYRDKKFEFKKDHPIDFLTPENLIFLIAEIIAFINEIVTHDKIKDIAEITHSYAEVEFVNVE